MAEPLQVGAGNLADYQLTFSERRYREARRKPTPLELQRPYPEKWPAALAALQEIRKQLSEDDPMIAKIAKKGVWIFSWPGSDEGGPNVGFDIKKEDGRDFHAYVEARVTEAGIEWANVDWDGPGANLRVSVPGAEVPPPQALLFALDTVAETEIAVEKSERVYRGVHYLGRSSAAYRTYTPPPRQVQKADQE